MKFLSRSSWEDPSELYCATRSEEQAQYEQEKEEEKINRRRERLYAVWEGIEKKIDRIGDENVQQIKDLFIRHEAAFQAVRKFESQMKGKK